MIIQVIDIPTITPLGKNTVHHKVELECDQCHNRYIGSAHYTAILKKKTHFCSRKCVAQAHTKGEILDIKHRMTSLEKYGVDHPSQAQLVEEKRVRTCVEKYGDTSPMHSTQVLERRSENLFEKYGVRHAMQIPGVHAKGVETMIERYGVHHALLHKPTKDKVNWPERCKRAHETMKRNGTYRKSKPEDRLYTILCQRFDANDVERQVHVPGTPKQWSFDFLVRSTGTYIQLDGVYWHGLDRPITEHHTSLNPRSHSITKKWATDRAQEKWFVEHKLCLLRITDDAIVTYDDALPLTGVAYFDSTRHF